VDLFLFPHQDDEYFVGPLLERTPARARCVFLTDGGYRGTGHGVRNNESLRALRRLGVAADQIVFAAEELDIRDNDLASSLPAAFARLTADGTAGVERIVVPAYEGGHPDHDAACLLGHALASRWGGIPVLEFAAYRAHPFVPHFYSVMSPLPGRIAAGSPPPRERFSWGTFTLFRCYPSQWRTWAGLLPPLVLNFLAGRRAGIYSAPLTDFRRRPHEGKLYYEYRDWSTFERFVGQTEEFRRAHLISML
jgi:hypothetical protein